jgi:hypothetical protein
MNEPIITMLVKVSTKRKIVKLKPRNFISTSNCGIFNAAQDPRKITILDILALLLRSEDARGKAT